MQSEAPQTEAATAEGAAFPLPVKALASLLVAALLFWGIRAAADQIVGIGWSAGAVAFMAITLCVFGLCYYWIMCSRTAIDATSIRQTWLWPKRVALADITQAKFIYVPYLRWLIAPRLIVRARGLGMFVFHAADDKVLQKFVNLSFGAIADTTPRQKIPARESQVAGMPDGKCVADQSRGRRRGGHRAPEAGQQALPPPTSAAEAGGLPQEIKLKDPNWLEVAHNGQWWRSRQPDIPVRANQLVNLALVKQARRRIQHAGQELSP